jgi:hypothetical protein
MAMLFGKIVSDADRARYDALSNIDKRIFANYNQQVLEEEAAAAKLASLPQKPSNWDRGSPADHREWYLKAQREAKENG